MSLSIHTLTFGRLATKRSSSLLLIGLAAGMVTLACRDGDGPVVVPTLELSAITVDGGNRVLERGTVDTMTATALDRAGQAVPVPVVWRSSNESVAVFERGGVLVALDVGSTTITSSSLGVTSAPVSVTVVWVGPAEIAATPWTAPTALNPGATLTDSVRVVVTNVAGAPVAGARVAFTVVNGGGFMSPEVATTNENGVAASQWTVGLATGINTVTASVVRVDGTPDTLVANNAVTYTVRSYVALTVEDGNAQSGQILDALPVAPSVRLVDSLGVPRPGVPVIFTPFENGLVERSVVSTNSNGIATPGTWTLGDLPGSQALEARVADARVVFAATGTGTPIRYEPERVIAGQNGTCALEANGTVTCWGESPQNGSGAPGNVTTPTPVSGGLVAASVASGPAEHFCALTSAGEAWCWGSSALVDTTGANPNPDEPTPLQSTLTWMQISAGAQHNCALTTGRVAYCWGSNQKGQLGDLTTAARFVPQPVAGGFAFSGISAGGGHTCGLGLDGSAFCWGGNQFGQIGNGQTSAGATTSPTTVAGGLRFQALGAGDSLSCGLSTAGTAHCWGKVADEALVVPTGYATAPTFTSITVGGTHACALTGDGTAYCWGTNQYGQLGDSTVLPRKTPTKVAGSLRYVELSAGFHHTCGRTTEGAVACWGRNTAGELGENTSAFRTTPRHIVLGVEP